MKKAEEVDIVHRLRCMYPVGPMINGAPEFGWRNCSGRANTFLPTPLMLEAATEIEEMRKLIRKLLETIQSANDQANQNTAVLRSIVTKLESMRANMPPAP